MRKLSKKVLIKKVAKECQRLCYAIVKNRDKECQLCGKKDNLHQHHILSKGRHFAVRYDPDNIITLCYYCHLIKVHSEGNQELGLYLISKHGQAWFDKLRAKAKQIVPDKLAHLIEARDILQKELGYEK